MYNEPLGTKYFHMGSFPQRLVLIERQKPSWKWSIVIDFKSRVHMGPGKPGQSWNFAVTVALSRTFQSWKRVSGPGNL